MPMLTNKIIEILKSGIIYIHGRCKDFQPIVILDFIKLEDLLTRKVITNFNFCSAHNFLATYIENNMLLPGQVEKWSTITNIN